MYHIFCVHSSVDGHLGYFHVLDVVNSASVSIGGTCIFWDYSILQVYAQEWDCWVMYMVVLFFSFFFFPFIFISWRLITLQYCSGFFHTLT